MKRLLVILPLLAIFSFSFCGCRSFHAWYADYDGEPYGKPPHRHPSHGYGVYGPRKKLRKQAGGLFKPIQHINRYDPASPYYSEW